MNDVYQSSSTTLLLQPSTTTTIGLSTNNNNNNNNNNNHYKMNTYDTVETGTSNVQHHYTRYSDDDSNDNNNDNTTNKNKNDNNINDDNHIQTTLASIQATTWTITNFGVIPDPYQSQSQQQQGDNNLPLLLSKDGSKHVTDEVFNTGTHVFATLISLLGGALLITQSSNPMYGPVSPWKIISFSIYSTSLVFLFVCSSLHHGINSHTTTTSTISPTTTTGSTSTATTTTTTNNIEYIFRVMDYIAIYPLIAGTFTPLCLVFYNNNSIGWIFCSTVWFISIICIICTGLFFTKIPKWLNITVYITLGWLGSCMSYWLLPKLTVYGYSLFILGGIIYTIGGIIYSTEQPNPYPGRFGFHEIWHICVVVAAACHWLMMYCYVLPYNG